MDLAPPNVKVWCKSFCQPYMIKIGTVGSHASIASIPEQVSGTMTMAGNAKP